MVAWNDLVDELRSLSVGPSKTTRVGPAELIARVSQPHVFDALLGALSTDRLRLEAVARRSFAHTNYFDKIVLLDEELDSAFRLTVHLWRPPFTQGELSDDHIHDHRCDFWSSVLFGALRSEEFARASDGQLFQEVIYRPERTRSGRKVNTYEPIGPARLRSEQSVRHRAGSTYFLGHDTIHRIVISSHHPTATLLLKGPHLTDSTHLFSNTRQYADIDLRAFDVPTLADRLQFVRRHLR